ncbi:hypothetical protein OMO38_17225 [Chryseobacterium sp. 09-1422]|uniref:Uncharacterized protein n=1 Tax=Chryseobacterium kimseyorum TaxID=2984028 RepID=A0ABT3I349_9FLAO|nr:hypothetical protein [Chryseobacterium kimseyorum]MCW3170273.1 hypothetical protein [Chryseobacterium kimseyorum]
MEDDKQVELRDFIISTLRVYVNEIGTEKDTEESYLSVFKSIQDYKGKVVREDFKSFLSEIQNVLLFENENQYRKKAGEFLLDLVKSKSSIEFIIGRWYDYYSEIIKDVKTNTFQNNEMENTKNLYIFYLYFDKNNDECADVQKIVCNRELLVGDILNFSDNEILENLEYIYKTPLFKIVKREYSVEFGEMNLHLVQYSE